MTMAITSKAKWANMFKEKKQKTRDSCRITLVNIEIRKAVRGSKNNSIYTISAINAVS